MLRIKCRNATIRPSGLLLKHWSFTLTKKSSNNFFLGIAKVPYMCASIGRLAQPKYPWLFLGSKSLLRLLRFSANLILSHERLNRLLVSLNQLCASLLQSQLGLSQPHASVLVLRAGLQRFHANLKQPPPRLCGLQIPPLPLSNHFS